VNRYKLPDEPQQDDDAEPLLNRLEIFALGVGLGMMIVVAAMYLLFPIPPI
jgi:hypothetical protein